MYNLIPNTCTHLWNHQHNSTRTRPSSSEVSSCPSGVPPPPPGAIHLLSVTTHQCALPKLYAHGVIQYVLSYGMALFTRHYFDIHPCCCVYKSLYGHLLSFLLGTHWEGSIYGRHMLNILRNSQTVFKVLAPFSTPTSSAWEPGSCTFSSALDVITCWSI